MSVYYCLFPHKWREMEIRLGIRCPIAYRSEREGKKDDGSTRSERIHRR